MMAANNMTGVTDMTNVEMPMTENERMGEPLMTGTTTKMASNEMIIMQTTEINNTEISEITEVPKSMTETLEMTVD